MAYIELICYVGVGVHFTLMLFHVGVIMEAQEARVLGGDINSHLYLK